MRKVAFVGSTLAVVIGGAGAFAATEEFRLHRRMKTRVSMCYAIGDFDRDGALDRVALEVTTHKGPSPSLDHRACSDTNLTAHEMLGYADHDHDGDGAYDTGTHDFCVDERMVAKIQHIECREPSGVTYHSLRGADCDDTNPAQSSQHTEIVGDGVDNNCDGEIE
jgi:hypothetical protein